MPGLVGELQPPKESERQVTTRIISASDTDDWGTCPNCGSASIEGGPFDVDQDGASQRITCVVCDLTWREVYVPDRRVIEGLPELPDGYRGADVD